MKMFKEAQFSHTCDCLGFKVTFMYLNFTKIKK